MATVEELAVVDVAELVEWLAAIPAEEWPGMADPAWHGGGECFASVVDRLTASFPGCISSGAGLFLLAAGQEHPMHVDEQPPQWVTRIHVPLVTNELCTVTTDEGRLHMQVGRAYTFNTRRNHAVENRGKTPRAHLVFDVVRA